MIDHYIPKHFGAYELVPERVYEDRGGYSFQLIDVRVLITLDQLREAYGSIIVNDWHWGGKNQWRGLRTSESPYGSEYSQHRFGRAADCIFAKLNSEIVRQDILKHPDRFPYIMSLELNTPHLHFDCRNCDRIMTYNP